jgi:hypothetical protein
MYNWAKYAPVILVEVQDVCTRPWRYAAHEIIDFLARKLLLICADGQQLA